METERLFLRRFCIDDARTVYKYASDPDVGPAAGWRPHKSEEESREIIQSVLSGPECWAVCLKETGEPVGAAELMLRSDLTDREDECELGYWLAKPYWGMGIMPEAAGELLRRGFEELGMRAIWCCCHDGNTRSGRVQEKLGFRYQRTVEDAEVPALGEKRTKHVSLLTREEWLENVRGEKNRRLYLRQKALLDTFLEKGAISRAQYRKSLGDLTEKMGYSD